MSATVKTLADRMRAAMYVKERDNGAEYVLLRDDAPAWMTEVCHAAHGDEMLPDDELYRMIAEAVDALAEVADDATPDEESDALSTITSATRRASSAVSAWLASYPGIRLTYADDAAREFGLGRADTFTRLAAGVDYEQAEVFGLVLESLRDLAEAFSVNDATPDKESDNA